MLFAWLSRSRRVLASPKMSEDAKFFSASVEPNLSLEA